MSRAEEIFESICGLLSNYAAGSEITRDTRIVTDLEIDSVTVFDLIMEVEDAHNINISMEMISATHTVGELTTVVETLILADKNA